MEGSTARAVKPLALLMALAVLLGAACSTSSETGSGSGSTTTTSGSMSDLPDGDDLDGAADFADSFFGEACGSAAIYYSILGIAGMAALGGIEEADIEEYRQTLEDLRADLPSEVADDMDVVARAYGEFFDALSSVDGNMFDPGYIEALEAAGAAVETPEVEAANDRITAWFEESCTPGS